MQTQFDLVSFVVPILLKLYFVKSSPLMDMIHENEFTSMAVTLGNASSSVWVE